ncbi:hypothetical protein ACHAPU_011230 [Fusarium lateritium]
MAAFLDTNLTIPLTELLDGVSTHDISAEDSKTKAMASLDGFVAENSSELTSQAIGSEVLRNLLRDADLTVPAAQIHLVAPTVRHFDSNWSMHPQPLQHIASTVRTLLRKSGFASPTFWFYPEDAFDQNLRDILTNLSTDGNPFANYLRQPTEFAMATGTLLGPDHLHYGNVARLGIAPQLSLSSDSSLPYSPSDVHPDKQLSAKSRLPNQPILGYEQLTSSEQDSYDDLYLALYPEDKVIVLEKKMNLMEEVFRG